MAAILPDFMWHKIFQYAPLDERLLSLSLVCQNWYNIMPYNLAWKNQNNPRGKKWKFNVDTLLSYVNEQRLYSNSGDSKPDFLNALLEHICGKINDQLIELSFPGSSPFYTEIKAEHLESILSNCTAITTLKFGSKIDIQPECASMLVNFENLNTLAITADEKNEEALANAFMNMRLQKLTLNGNFNRDLVLGDGTSISSITLANFQPFHGCMSLTEPAPLPQQWPNLHKFHCSSAESIRAYIDNQLLQLLRLFPSLRSSNLTTDCHDGDLVNKVYMHEVISSLTIVDCRNIETPTGFKYWFPSLKKLTLSQCTLGASDVKWILAQPNLRSLKFENFIFMAMTDSEPRSFHVACKSLKYFQWNECSVWSEMKSFLSSGVSQGAFSSAFNQEADLVLGTILDNCDQLEIVVIDAYYPQLAKNLAMYGMGEKCRLRKLGIRLPDVDYWKNCLNPLCTTTWPSVRSLIFMYEGRMELDDPHIAKFCTSFPNLRHLKFKEPYVGGSGTVLPCASACSIINGLAKLETICGIRIPYSTQEFVRFFESVTDHLHISKLSVIKFQAASVKIFLGFRKQLMARRREIRKSRLVKPVKLIHNAIWARANGGEIDILDCCHQVVCENVVMMSMRC